MNGAIDIAGFGEDIAASARVALAEAEEDTPKRRGSKPRSRRVRAQFKDFLAEIEAMCDPKTMEQQFQIPSSEFAQWSFVPTSESEQPLVPHILRYVDGFDRENGQLKARVRRKIIQTTQQLRHFAESAEYKRSRFFEATGDWTRPEDGQYRRCVESFRPEKGYRLREADTFSNEDRGADLSPDSGMNQEYIPILGGPYHRQLYQFAHWEQISKAFYEKNHNEVASAAVQITTEFSIGHGIMWKMANADCRRVWEHFWSANKMEETFEKWCDDTTWAGELMVHMHEKLAGYLSVKAIEPSSIYEIVTDPTDINEVFFYHHQAPSLYQMPFSDFKGTKVDVPLFKYVITQYGANEVIHIRNNVSSVEKRGRSDFFPSFNSLKKLRDWTTATALKDVLQANLVWKIKIKGDQQDMDAFVADPDNTKLPAFGDAWVENDAVALEALHQDVAQSGRFNQGSTGSFLIALFAAQQRMPVAYFNAPGAGGARATALQQGEPFVKKITRRQQMWRRLLDRLYYEVITRAVRVGRLRLAQVTGPGSDPEWIFPEIFEEDRGAWFRDAMIARSEKVVSHKTIASRMAVELGFKEYDYEGEQAQIKKEADAGILPPAPPAPADQVPGAPGAPGTAPGSPTVPGPAPGAPPGRTMQPARRMGLGSATTTKGRGEAADGDSARRNFTMRQARTSEQPTLGPDDSRFLETLFREIEERAGATTLPSGGRVVARESSYFSDCPRDDRGWCTTGTGAADIDPKTDGDCKKLLGVSGKELLNQTDDSYHKIFSDEDLTINSIMESDSRGNVSINTMVHRNKARVPDFGDDDKAQADFLANADLDNFDLGQDYKNEVALITRTYEKVGGKLEVSRDTFRLADNERGKGYSLKVLTEEESRWKRMGVKRVTTHCVTQGNPDGKGHSWIGAYVWAKMDHYDFKDQNTRKLTVALFKDYLSTRTTKAFKSNTKTRPVEIAKFRGDNNEEFGKMFLLGDGTPDKIMEWHGVRDL